MLRSSVFLLMLAPSLSWAADVPADPSNYLTMLDTLGPGDALILAPGDYTNCMLISGMHGTESDPIVIEGPAPYGGGVRFLGSNCVAADGLATIFMEDSNHLVIRNLDIDLEGVQVNGIRAGFGTTPVHHVTLEFLRIHGNNVNNQYSGISAFATTWDWIIRDNQIEDVGLGMYLGDSDGGDPFIRGLIERNLILNARGYGMQIKHQFPRINVAGMPQDDSVTILRHNVFIKAENSGLGNDARPNLLIGDLPISGVGANDRYEIYGNFFYQNQTDVEPLFQGEGNLSFHDNVMVNAFLGNGILIQPHNGGVREIGVFHNTIVTEGIGISITGGQAGTAQRVFANAVYGNGVPVILGGDAFDNNTGTLTEASGIFNDPTPVLGQLDLYPQDDATLRGPIVDLGPSAFWTDVDVDFNGDPRDGTYRGAYAGSGANPGWPLAAENRPRPQEPNPMDAGVMDSGPMIDAGMRTDAGMNADAASPDGGNPGQDVGVTPDAGSGRPDTGVVPEPESEGCGCSSSHERTASSPLWLLMLLLIPLGMRRITERSGCSRSTMGRAPKDG